MTIINGIEMDDGADEPDRPMVCAKFSCNKAKLLWLKKRHSIQTRNGFFTAGGDGWVCPICGGGYGGTPHG